MCSGNMRDFEDWRDLNKLREEVKAQKARVERLQAEQKWMKGSLSASDLCVNPRIDRSDSGIDRQSLMMDGRRNHDCESSTNILNQDCSTSSIKKIIEITSLIRAIELQLNVSNNFNDTESVKTYNSSYSMPRCFHEVPEQEYGSSSWIHNQLVTSLIEQEKLNKQLNHCHTQIFKIENVNMTALLNGITTEQLKKRVDEYYQLKQCLSELASSANCNSTAMITVVKQLEPIAQSVEQYFRLSQEVKTLHNEVNAINERKTELQNKRCQLLKILQLSIAGNPKIDVLPQSASWNEPHKYAQSPFNNASYIARPLPTNKFIDKLPEDDINVIIRGVTWPPFNGDGITELHPPAYDESVINNERKSKGHSRAICHEYVNDDVINGRVSSVNREQTIDLMISSFPYESIAIVQIHGFKLCLPLQFNQQYRARLLQMNGDSSDWNNACVNGDGLQIVMSPLIMLPIKWSFNPFTNLTLILEVQLCVKKIGSQSNCFMFHFVPPRTHQNLSVSMQTMQPFTPRSVTRCDTDSPSISQPKNSSLKLPPRTSAYDDVFYPQTGMNLLTNPILNRDCPPIHYSSIRRSQTYSHDHQYCGDFECCSSIDFVSEPIPKINPKYISQPFNSPQPFRNYNFEGGLNEESGCISTNSSFKRQSVYRQPIRLKRNLSENEVNSDQHSQTSELHNNDILIQELWSIVCDLYLDLNACSSHDERILEYAYFKTRCPTNLMKLYDYFVEIIFEADQK